MIPQTHRKIDFIEYIPGKTAQDRSSDKPLTLTVSAKFGMVHFNKTLCYELGMIDKFIRLFYEPHKKIIGWRILERSIEHEKMRGIKLVKLNESTKSYKVSIHKMLREFKGLKDAYPELPVKKYVDQDMLNKGDTYYYVKLKDNKEEDDE